MCMHVQFHLYIAVMKCRRIHRALRSSATQAFSAVMGRTICGNDITTPPCTRP